MDVRKRTLWLAHISTYMLYSCCLPCIEDNLRRVQLQSAVYAGGDAGQNDPGVAFEALCPTID